MPSSSVRAFTDPDEYAASMREANVALTVMQVGTFKAKLCRIDLHRLRIKRFSADLGWTSHIDYWGGQTTFTFQTQPGPNMMRHGRECAYDSVTRLNSAHGYYLHSPTAASYGTVSLPFDEISALASATNGRDPVSPEDYVILTPLPSALAKLRRLHEAAGNLAEDASAVLAQLGAARGLEQALIEAMWDCVGGQVEEDRAAQRHHETIMRRFHRVVEEHLDDPLYITELCKEVGASERTLNTCCHEHLGMGPKHYLLLRRMHMVRRELHESAPGATTVTEVAARYGFWQFGRLAVEYKALFGEAPSATLAR